MSFWPNLDSWEWKLLGGLVAVCIGLLALCLASWIFSSYMEAKTYNEVTGAHVTTWQAMWVELKVQDQAK